MASFLKIDSNNLISNGLNNTWRYQFPSTAVDFTGVEFAVQSISLFNSQFNIDPVAFGNNEFVITVPTAATSFTIAISLPAGYYSYADINAYIQTQLIAAGAYLIDSTGKYVFYVQLTENATYYAAQIDFALTPTTLPSGYTQPSTGLYSATGTGLPTVATTPSIIIGNSAFGTVLGLSAATYPASTAVASSQLSNIIPQVHPASSYVVRCDLVKNDFDVSGEVLAAFNRSGSSIGELMTFSPSEYIWVPAHEGQRSTINISIYDQADRPVHFRDTSVSIMLIFRKARA